MPSTSSDKKDDVSDELVPSPEQGFGGSEGEIGEKFSFEEFISKWRYQFMLLLLGAVFISLGVFYFKRERYSGNKIEVLDVSTEDEERNILVVVEISGSVEKPGVYRFQSGARVEDLLIASGGIAADADRDWIDKRINRAAKLVDGQKLYIPLEGEAEKQSKVLSANNIGSGSETLWDPSLSDTGVININNSTQKQLEELPGIGPVYAQSIIEHRPYSNTGELVSKGAIKQFVYEKIKDRVSIY